LINRSSRGCIGCYRLLTEDERKLFRGGVIGRIEIFGFDAFVDGEGASRFGLGGFTGFFPLGVGPEGGPGGFGCGFVFVGEEVDEGVRFVGGEPVAEVGHAALFEQFDGVISETFVEVVEAAFVGGVGAEFEEALALL
jgi:hypothetical protein